MSPFGAMPPPHLAWQMGKTAATIRFVQEAEQAILTDSVTGDEAAALRETIERMKRGEESLDDWQTVDQWLERLRDYHP